MRLLIGLAVALATAGTGCAFLAAGTGDGSPTKTRETARVETVTVRDSRFGRILFDGRGFVLYAFTKDTRGASDCYGACAEAWPPLASLTATAKPSRARPSASRRLALST